MLRLLLLLCVALLASCALVEKISPYHVDTQQGHILSREAVAKLKTGMTKEQVRFILGTPLIDDAFHADRLDYVYHNQKGRGPVEQGRLTLYFKQNRLERIDTDLVPRPSVAAVAIEAPVKKATGKESAAVAVQPAADTANKSAVAAASPIPAAARQPESLEPPPRPAVPQNKVDAKPADGPSVASDEKLIAQTLQAWSSAWIRQDIEAYLAFYAKTFSAPDNESRGKWEQTRRTRVLRPKKIEIRLSALQVRIASPEKATAIFRQDYRSSLYSDQVIKELTFVKENGIWRIGRERVVKAD